MDCINDSKNLYLFIYFLIQLIYNVLFMLICMNGHFGISVHSAEMFVG